MGIGKIGTTIGKEIIAWTRTSGKSLLATKPVKVTLSDLEYTSKLKTDTFVKKVECKETHGLIIVYGWYDYFSKRNIKILFNFFHFINLPLYHDLRFYSIKSA